MNKKLRVLLSGPGLIGRKHVELIQAHEDCELIGIVGPATSENQEFASSKNAKLYPEFADAIVLGEVDASIISSPNGFHYEQAMACVSLGIPTLVEKPLTDNIEDAARLVEQSERVGVPVLVGHHRTYSSLLDIALKFLSSDSFGRMVALQGSALFYKPETYFQDGPWRTTAGGGPILINLIHEIGLMRQFAGEIVSVQALESHHIRKFEVEDTVAIAFRFKDGALGTFILSDAAASSKSWEMTSGENPAYPHFPDENCYHFAGTNGSLDFPSMKAKSYGSDVTPSWWNQFNEHSIPIERKDPLRLQLDHFVDVVRHGAEPRVSARDGYLNMLVIEAIHRSIETGSVVDVADTYAVI
tara:strand:+ start:180 stop:1250 length:1071 start_codon:yes stop_codon:yes gene_type:complete